jgi:hypothetical protein
LSEGIYFIFHFFFYWFKYIGVILKHITTMSGVLPQSVDNVLKATVEAHYQIAAAVIVVLVLLVILCYFRKERFNPTATMYKIGQDQQGVGWTASENRERAEGGKPAAAPAQAGPKEGSASWAVLHSDDFACDKRDPVGDDAWGWMVGHSKDAESAHGGRGRLSEGALTKSMAGQN